MCEIFCRTDVLLPSHLLYESIPAPDFFDYVAQNRDKNLLTREFAMRQKQMRIIRLALSGVTFGQQLTDSYLVDAAHQKTSRTTSNGTETAAL
jgi:hypothetical protein